MQVSDTNASSYGYLGEGEKIRKEKKKRAHSESRESVIELKVKEMSST